MPTSTISKKIETFLSLEPRSLGLPDLCVKLLDLARKATEAKDAAAAAEKQIAAENAAAAAKKQIAAEDAAAAAAEKQIAAENAAAAEKQIAAEDEAVSNLLAIYFLSLLAKEKHYKRLYESDFNNLQRADVASTWEFYKKLMRTTHSSSLQLGNIELWDGHDTFIPYITTLTSILNINPFEVKKFHRSLLSNGEQNPFSNLAKNFNIDERKPTSSEDLASSIKSLSNEDILRKDSQASPTFTSFVAHFKTEKELEKISEVMMLAQSEYKTFTAAARAKIAVKTKNHLFAIRALETSFGATFLGFFGRGPTSNHLTAKELLDILEAFPDNQNIVNRILGDKGFFGGKNFWKVIRSDEKAMMRLIELTYEESSKTADKQKIIINAINKNGNLESAMISAAEHFRLILSINADNPPIVTHPSTIVSLLKQPKMISSMEFTSQQLANLCKKTIYPEDLFKPEFSHLLPMLPNGIINSTIKLSDLPKDVQTLFSLDEAPYQAEILNTNSPLRLFSSCSQNALRNTALRRQDLSCSRAAADKLSPETPISVNSMADTLGVRTAKIITTYDGSGLDVTRLFDGLPSDFDPSFQWIQEGIRRSLNDKPAIEFFVKCAIIQGCVTLFNSDGTPKETIFQLFDNSESFTQLLDNTAFPEFNLINLLKGYLLFIFGQPSPSSDSSSFQTFSQGMTQKAATDSLKSLLGLGQETETPRFFEMHLPQFKKDIFEALALLKTRSVKKTSDSYKASCRFLDASSDMEKTSLWDNLNSHLRKNPLVEPTDEVILNLKNSWNTEDKNELSRLQEKEKQFLQHFINARRHLHKQLSESMPSVEENVDITLSLSFLPAPEKHLTVAVSTETGDVTSVMFPSKRRNSGAAGADTERPPDRRLTL